MRPSLLLVLAGLTGLAAPSTAQQAAEPAGLGNPLESVPWRIPLHSAPDDPAGGAYGTWAAGPDYKASFHDGFVFVPVLGPSAPRNLPVRWLTEEVARGGRKLPLAAEADGRVRGSWRYEYDHGSVIEAYDVGVRGVEQSFQFTRRPMGSGDLVITGRLESELQVTDQPATHGALELLRHDGTPVVRYGAATAIDANGRSLPVATAVADSRVRLIVDGRWLDEARFPVVVDPLTQSVPLVTRADPVDTVDICYGEGQVCVVESRAVSSSDYDSRGFAVRDHLGTTIFPVMADVTSQWSTRYNQVAFNAHTPRSANPTWPDYWGFVLQRDFASRASIRVYIHEQFDPQLNGGNWHYHTPASGNAYQMHPSIGGNLTTYGGPEFYLAFEDRTSPGSSTSSIVGCPVSHRGFGNDDLLELGWSSRPEWPCVQRSYDTSPVFAVVWQSYSTRTANDDWDIHVRLIGSYVFSKTAMVTLGSGSAHHLRPKVASFEGLAGSYAGTYAVAYTSLTNNGYANSGGNAVVVQRFDWDGWQITTLPPQTVARAPRGGDVTTGDGNRGIAMDAASRSHWAVAWEEIGTYRTTRAARVGHDGKVTERLLLQQGSSSSSSSSPSAVWNPSDREFVLAWGSRLSGPLITAHSTRAARLQYSAAAQVIRYGTACPSYIGYGNPEISSNPVPPLSGSGHVVIDLSIYPSWGTATLLLSFGRGNVPLPGGCTLLLNPQQVIAVATMTPYSVEHELALPAIQGDLFWQWVQLDPSTARIQASDAMEMRVR